MHHCLVEINGETFTDWCDRGYPRPALCRRSWLDLTGTWEFVEDVADRGLSEKWYCESNWPENAAEITVPFPPGSELSGYRAGEQNQISDVIWYRTRVSPEKVREIAGEHPEQQEVRINFEAVDFKADVWLNGVHTRSHEGGYTPFFAPIALDECRNGVDVVVRAEDLRADVSQPRGKQGWRDQSDVIWYGRSSGIWRPVWAEVVAQRTMESLSWEFNPADGFVRLRLVFNAVLPPDTTAHATLRRDGVVVAHASVNASGHQSDVHLPLPHVMNREDRETWLWSPERPVLLDADISITWPGGQDEALSYCGLRTVGTTSTSVLVNGVPTYLRGVLDQGYWPSSLFTPPTPGAGAEDLELMKAMGFNWVRIHERTADRRYLAEADRLGLMVWSEAPSAYRFDDVSIQRLLREWAEIVVEDRQHPCVVGWVPVNESWGVPDLEVSPRQRSLVRALSNVAHALDGSRPVIANDGWEQVDSDIISIHDYSQDPGELATRYSTWESIERLLHGDGPQGRRLTLAASEERKRPVIISEFGGVALANRSEHEWGYGSAESADELVDVLRSLFEALRRAKGVSGFCYTQFTDTAQEANGLCTPDRTPKMPLKLVQDIVRGTFRE